MLQLEPFISNNNEWAGAMVKYMKLSEDLTRNNNNTKNNNNIETRIHKINTERYSIIDDSGIFVDSLARGINILNELNIESNDKILISNANVMSCIVIHLIKQMRKNKETKVICIDSNSSDNEWKLNIAKEYGADKCYSSIDDNLTGLTVNKYISFENDITNKNDYNNNLKRDKQLIKQLMKENGLFIKYSFNTNKSMDDEELIDIVDKKKILFKEIDANNINGNIGNGEYYESAIKMIEDKLISFDLILNNSETIGMSQFEKGFELAKQATKYMKIILDTNK